jgi:hypothetical protein
MRAGVSGHQKRQGIDWNWVRETLRQELLQVDHVQRALSSLAIGSDQIFAEVALSLGIPVTAVIPLADYERFFEREGLSNYLRLLEQCTPIYLPSQIDPERAFYEAGKFIVDGSDVLFAIWDGEKAEGFGGTADIVAYARTKGLVVIQIEPISRTINRLG